MSSTLVLLVGVSTLLLIAQLSLPSAASSSNNGLTLYRSSSRHALNKRFTIRKICRLPEQPRNGNYQSQCHEGDNSAACRNVPGTAVTQPWVLNYRCDKDYFLSPEQEYSICGNSGEWQPASRCIKKCRPLTSLSQNLDCFFGGREVLCDMHMKPYTTATAKCKPYYLPNPQQDLRCQENGEWDVQLENCTPMCGVPSLRKLEHPMIHDTKKMETTLEDFSWAAAIYKLNIRKSWDYTCDGTVITPHIVLTVAQCVNVLSSSGLRKLLPEELFVSLRAHISGDVIPESDSDAIDVRGFVIRGDGLDVALLDLVHSVQMNVFVMPVCVDWDSNYIQPVSNYTVGYIGGRLGSLGNTTNYNRIVSVPLKGFSKDVSLCNMEHMFCTDNINGYIEPGRSLTVIENQKHFVVGVFLRDHSSRLVFYNIQYNETRHWILQKKDYFTSLHWNETHEIQRSINNTNPRRPVTPALPVGYCSLPQQPNNGNYVSWCQPEDQSAACRNVPGTVVRERWGIEYNCDHTYNLSSTEISHSICRNGTWVPSIHCIKLCPPLISISNDVRCHFSGREVSCDSPMRPTTTATARCKEHYDQDQPPQDILCHEVGEWSGKLHHCTPLCGRSTPTGSLQPLITNGRETKRGEFPWLVAVYHKNKTRLWEQMCGGTIITSHMILTAAHCVILSSGPLLAVDVKVGLGKYFRDYYRHEDGSLIVDVREIATPPNYAGPVNKYTLDIALLDLVHSVEINTFVMPACVDWTSNHIQLNSSETVGFVAGWGKTEDQQDSKPSENILAAQLTYISNVECKKTFSTITHDKFCGRSINGSQVLRGDSGGGFTVVKNEQHFVVGIVSAKAIAGTEISLFTEIQNLEHITWMKIKRNNFIAFHYNET